MQIFELFGTLGLKADGFFNGIKEAKQESEGFRLSFGKVAGGIAKAGAAIGAAIGAVGVAAIKVGGDFQSSMNTIQANTGMAAADVGKLGMAFRDMALEGNFGAREIADAFGDIAVAGQDVEHGNDRVGINKDISCRVVDLPQVFWHRKQLRFDISLAALDPFWKGQSVIQIIAETLKEFFFPAYIPKEGMSFGVRHRTLESEFDNQGNVESGFFATFRARGGTVINPFIENMATGDRIRMSYTMAANDVITILSDLQEKRVEINGVNGFRHLDAAATEFFRVEVGANRIGFGADVNINNLHVHIRYIPNYTFAEG